MKRIRCLVVEDSPTVRGRLVDVLSADPGIEIVGEAADGRTAIECCRVLRPDVITLDMMLPVMTGVAVTEYVMAHFPIPILIVSASINRGELFRTYDALAAGAVDVLEKPNGSETEGVWENRLISAVKLVSKIKVITHPRLRIASLGRAARTIEPQGGGRQYNLIVMGASTGGPAAVVEVLRGLPVPLPVPLLLTIHIGEPFGRAFAEWLDGQTEHRVSYAVGGEKLVNLAGRVIMAPPDRHLVMTHGTLHLSAEPERHSCRPSVDVLFESAAREMGATTIACLLTGMGRDGARGMLDIRRTGGLTIAQDEATSVVYGMPREAVLLDAVERSLPLAEIGAVIAAEMRENRAPK